MTNTRLPSWLLPLWLLPRRVRAGRLLPSREARDAGTAVVEFALIGVLLLVPLVYLAVALGRIQAGTLAAQSGARAAVRAMTAAPTSAQGRRRATTATALAVTDQGFDPDSAALSLTCSAPQCLTPGAQVHADVRVRVLLPGLPAFVDSVVPVGVTVRASQLAVVDELRAAAR